MGPNPSLITAILGAVAGFAVYGLFSWLTGSRETPAWSTQNVISTAGIVISTGALVFSSMQFIISSTQLSLATPPRLELRFPHMWEHGRGGPFHADNPIPLLNSDTLIDASLSVVNFGSSDAEIIRSDLLLKFFPQPLTMNFPGWNNPGGKGLHLVGPAPAYDLTSKANTLRPGDTARWSVSGLFKANTDGRSDDVWLVGSVAYKDRLGTFREITFAYRYDKGLKDFVIEHYQINERSDGRARISSSEKPTTLLPRDR